MQRCPESHLGTDPWHPHGVATTSENYTIAHSNHVGVKFFALKWQNLPMFDDDGESSSEDYNYRPINERAEATHSEDQEDHRK